MPVPDLRCQVPAAPGPQDPEHPGWPPDKPSNGSETRTPNGLSLRKEGWLGLLSRGSDPPRRVVREQPESLENNRICRCRFVPNGGDADERSLRHVDSQVGMAARARQEDLLGARSVGTRRDGTWSPAVSQLPWRCRIGSPNNMPVCCLRCSPRPGLTGPGRP
jgi:hypothetical protein